MLPGKPIWKPLVQKAVTGRAGNFRLTKGTPSWPVDIKNPGLYLHVPFCENLCPYCPYNRIAYDESLFGLYVEAVKKEIDLYAPHLSGLKYSSLYIGGGTPTVNWRGLLAILAHLSQRFGSVSDICIELHPASMGDDCLAALRDNGITMLSIGVESTSDAILTRMGRRHSGREALNAILRAVAMGFKAVNVDLMFALPGQTLPDWQADLQAVVDSGIDQLSTYPLFSFPYSDLGKRQGIREVKRPRHRTVRAMLETTDEWCESKGLHRCAVWSWLRPSKGKFSSITRHHYIGLGPSAASMTGRYFSVNTFDVKAYIGCLPEARPIALVLPVDRRLEMAYWLYWRIYELKVDDRDFQSVFGADSSVREQFGTLLAPLRAIGMLKKSNGGYEVTRSGAYWIHRLQNEYSLSYINHLWGACRKEPWPSEVRL